jgi:23S rRNA (guanosine2251-2'-O)-methyltransferase
MKFLSNQELNRPDKQAFSEMKKLPYTVVLDNVRSGLNIGSVFRTADCFLAEKIMICGQSAFPPDKEILKTALGATESVDWEYHPNTRTVLESLKLKGYAVYAVEQCEGSQAPDAFVPPAGPFALVFGHEVRGVDKSLSDLIDGCIEIPQSGTKHSLNVSVAAGIVLWEMYRKLRP